jgi:lysophospholipase L1-like esterase
MTVANPKTYLAELVNELKATWPGNRTINIVCHGHSVPSGYFSTPVVDTFNAYPHLLHAALKNRFPFAVINVIVTAIGGENSEQGAARFDNEVLTHRPDVIAIDYGLNDRGMGLDKARSAWVSMIERAQKRNIKLLLCTPTSDVTQEPGYGGEDKAKLPEHAEQIRRLAEEYGIGLVDSLAAFEAHQHRGEALSDLLSAANHPNRRGHEIVAGLLLRWFPWA